MSRGLHSATGRSQKNERLDGLNQLNELNGANHLAQSAKNLMDSSADEGSPLNF
jgi:hypothetical protein